MTFKYVVFVFLYFLGCVLFIGRANHIDLQKCLENGNTSELCYSTID